MANRNDIPIGRSNAISRESLSRKWHCAERETRRRIAELRAASDGDGYAILSTAHSPSGYWRSDDPEEIAQFIRETEARGRNTFLAIREARKLLKRLDLQQKYAAMLDEGA